MEAIILGLGEYFFPFNLLSKQNRAERRRIRKPRVLKVRFYAACLIDFNKYLTLFPGEKLTDNIGVAELNEILLNSMPNSWIKQSYMQGFDCKYITLKKTVNIL